MLELVRALQWINTRAADRRRGARCWSEVDQATTDEALARAWGFVELQELAVWLVPSWITLLELPRRSSGFERFVGFVVRAYRAGAIGVALSYEEGMALCDAKSRATWRSWTRTLEQLGVIRIVQTWRKDPRGRVVYGRLLYRIGPKLEQLGGVALCENASTIGGPSRTWCARVAAKLRRDARAARGGAKGRAWQQCRERLRLTQRDATSSDVVQHDETTSSAELAGDCQSVACSLQSDSASRPCQPVADPVQSDNPRSRPRRARPASVARPSSSSSSTTPAARPSSPSSSSSSTSADAAELELLVVDVGELVDRGVAPTPARDGAPDPSREFSKCTPLRLAKGGAVKQAPSRRLVSDDEQPSAARAVSATPRSTSSPTSTTSSSSSAASADVDELLELGELGRAAGVVDDELELGRATDASSSSSGDASDGVVALEGVRRGLEIVATWVASTKPYGPTQRDALAELARSLERNAPPRCSTCDGAGGVYTKRSSKPIAGAPSWAPERRSVLEGWVECDDCGGSGEGP